MAREVGNRGSESGSQPETDRPRHGGREEPEAKRAEADAARAGEARTKPHRRHRQEQTGSASRVFCHFAGRLGFVATDQLRTLDGTRLICRLGRLPDTKVRQVLQILREMFAD